MKVIERIKDGLVEAALSTEAWIITSGLDNVCKITFIAIVYRVMLHFREP